MLSLLVLPAAVLADSLDKRGKLVVVVEIMLPSSV